MSVGYWLACWNEIDLRVRDLFTEIKPIWKFKQNLLLNIALCLSEPGLFLRRGMILGLCKLGHCLSLVVSLFVQRSVDLYIHCISIVQSSVFFIYLLYSLAFFLYIYCTVWSFFCHFWYPLCIIDIKRYKNKKMWNHFQWGNSPQVTKWLRN